METKFNVTGERRKELVRELGRIRGAEPLYKGAPTFAFAVAEFVIDRNGTLIYDGQLDCDLVARVISELDARGFAYQLPERLGIELPREGLTDAAIDNLRHLVESKAGLIRKALAADSVEIEVSADGIRFPWFERWPSPEEINAYARFIGGLVAMAKTLKRTQVKERLVEKIDGAVATIMALDRAIRNGNITSSSIYDDRGLLIL